MTANVASNTDVHILGQFLFQCPALELKTPNVVALRAQCHKRTSVFVSRHGFFSEAVPVDFFRIELARSSSSDCLAPLALVPTYCKAPTSGTGAFSGVSW